MQNKKFSPTGASFSNVPNCDPYGLEYMKHLKLVRKGETTEQAVDKIQLAEPTPAVHEDNQYLQGKRENGKMMKSLPEI